MRLRKIIIILIKLPVKSCGIRRHLRFDLEKCYTSSSVAQPDAWSANLGYTFVAKGKTLFPVLSLILESELKVDLERSEILKQEPLAADELQEHSAFSTGPMKPSRLPAASPQLV